MVSNQIRTQKIVRTNQVRPQITGLGATGTKKWIPGSKTFWNFPRRSMTQAICCGTTTTPTWKRGAETPGNSTHRSSFSKMRRLLGKLIRLSCFLPLFVYFCLINKKPQGQHCQSFWLLPASHWQGSIPSAPQWTRAAPVVQGQWIGGPAKAGGTKPRPWQKWAVETFLLGGWPSKSPKNHGKIIFVVPSAHLFLTGLLLFVQVISP